MQHSLGARDVNERGRPHRTARRRSRTAIARALPPLLLALALLGAWELYVDLRGRSARCVLPAPHECSPKLWNNAGLLVANLEMTAKEVGLGLPLALSAGFVMAVAIHMWPPMRRAVYPHGGRLAGDPDRADRGAAVFWWGFGIFPKLFVIVLICFFPVVVTTVDGLAAVDPDQLKLLRTLDASRWQALRFGELPAALPGGAQRRADRARGWRDRRVHRRDLDRHHRPLRRAGPRDHRGLDAPCRPPAPMPPRPCCSCSRSAASTPWPSPSASSRRGPTTKRRDPLRASSSVRRATLLCLPLRMVPAGRLRLLVVLGGVRLQAGCRLGARDEAVHGDARLVPQRRPRVAVHGDRTRRTSLLSASTCVRSCPANRPNR